MSDATDEMARAQLRATIGHILSMIDHGSYRVARSAAFGLYQSLSATPPREPRRDRVERYHEQSITVRDEREIAAVNDMLSFPTIARTSKRERTDVADLADDCAELANGFIATGTQHVQGMQGWVRATRHGGDIANASRPTCTCPMGHDIAWCSHRNAVYAFLVRHPEKYR